MAIHAKVSLLFEGLVMLHIYSEKFANVLHRKINKVDSGESICSECCDLTVQALDTS